MKVHNLFYEQPEFDRWIPFDRHPRRLIRRVIRGKPQASGHDRVFLNLAKGMDRIGAAYRVNDFTHIRRNSDEIACVVGKPHVVERIPPATPIVFGSAQFSHPLEERNFFERHRNIRRILVQGEWVRQMWEPFLGQRVAALPIGIETDVWCPSKKDPNHIRVILYDKVRWERERFEKTLVAPIRAELERQNVTSDVIRYGMYREATYREMLRGAHAMIFLCEHETQGFAYQQALSAGVPILAWDRGGLWRDPEFYPRIEQFGPVSSVPYWDSRCGMKFLDADGFKSVLPGFLNRLASFKPREFILDNLTLEQCAQRFIDLVAEVEASL